MYPQKTYNQQEDLTSAGFTSLYTTEDVESAINKQGTTSSC